ncbi:pih1d1 [Symbiodinium pilosum]|uniref:Pih1d1 protein n=1 Tax=Symbiodinium pilosum TaxID=2952 RepID=A0A812QUM4_SYMPI|nr:pih1d1 [Symbiodinium pilosum]
MKSYTELEGEQGCRVPLSIGVAVEDFDKKGEPCVTYDVVANPKVVEECSAEPAFREQVVQLCLAAVSQKYKLQLDQRFKLPKIKYKGTTVQLQRIRKKKESQIQEMPENTSAPQPGTSAQRRAAGESAVRGGRADGPQPPDFCVYYALPESQPLEDIFERDWGSPPDDVEEAAKVTYLYGFDLPCYRVNTFQEKIRGTMRNKADRQKDEEAEEGEVDAVARARKARFDDSKLKGFKMVSREMYAGNNRSPKELMTPIM